MRITVKAVHPRPNSSDGHLLQTLATLIIAALLASLSTYARIFASEPTSRSVPNIVLILADDKY